jgi:U4/U6 small nuclear ribonucleoprotein PRP31
MDNFLDDLNELESDTEDTAKNPKKPRKSEGHFAEDIEEEDDDQGNEDVDSDADVGDDDDAENLDKALASLVKAKNVSAIGSLRKQARYQRHLEAVTNALRNPPTTNNFCLLEDDPEYSLILACNGFIHEIDDEILSTHRYIADLYAKKFPELESLITNKIDFVRTVQRIGNETDLTLVELNDILSASLVMVVSVTGSATSGTPLDQSELAGVMRACDEVLRLVEDKNFNLQFVESRMVRLAPNLCALVGARIGAQLVGLAGGIVALSKIPACNIQVMGQEKRGIGANRYAGLGGFSTLAAMQHTGILHYCDVIQGVSPAFRRKALKVVAGKVALVARVDSFQTPSVATSYPSSNNVPVQHTVVGRNGATGERMRREIEEKLEKAQEPDKARTKKALPIPEEKKKSKRGGKRVRKMKERYAMTDIRQQHNRIRFGFV